METTEEKKEQESPYEFSVKWHLKHAESWIHIFEKNRPKRALEIGCYEGMSSVFMLEKARWLKELVCIDTWAGGPEHQDRDFSLIEGRFDKNIAAHKNGGIVKKMKGDSQDSLISLIGEGKKECYDFIYIDGNHTASGTLQDAVLCWKLLARDGVMVFDDYLWRQFPMNHTIVSPKIAIDAFTTIYANELMVLPIFPAYQVYCVKSDIFGWHKQWMEKNPGVHPMIEG